MNDTQEKAMSDFINWLPQNIVNFSDQLPKEIIDPIAKAQDPETVVNILNQLSESEEGTQLVKSLFEVFQSQTGLFKEGGKLYYGLKKMQQGGPIDKHQFYKIINAPGDTLMVKPYKWRTEERQTYPDGSIRYTTMTKSDIDTYWDPKGSKPSLMKRVLWLSGRTAPKSLLQNWRELMENHKDDTYNIIDKTKNNSK